MADELYAMKSPQGVTPDFEHSYSLARIVIPVFAICMVIVITSTILRFYAQWRLFGRLTWADFCIAVALCSHAAFSSVILAALPLGLGRHQWDVLASRYPSIQYLLYVSYILYDPAIAFTKLSILVQFLGIFAGMYRNRFWWAILVIIIINFLFYVPETLSIIFSCTPREKIWDASVQGGHCIDQKALLTASGPFNVVSDLAIFVLPLYAIWHLRLPLRKRFEVSAAFAVGFFGCVCSAVRIAYTVQLDRIGDGTFTITQNQMWANAEITVGILIANSIIMPRFIRHLHGGGSGSNSAKDKPGPADSLSSHLDSTLRNETGNKWRNRTMADGTVTTTPRTLVDELDSDSPFPSGNTFNQLAKPNSHELVTLDSDRERIAPWTSHPGLGWQRV